MQSLSPILRPLVLVLALIAADAVRAPAALAEPTAFRQAVAEAAAETALAEFYRARDFAPLWTGPEHAERRAALLAALESAADHGLPAARYDAAGMTAAFLAMRGERARGRLEVAMTRAFLDYARDVSSGVLVPSQVDPAIDREVVRPDAAELLAAFEAAAPRAFLRGLAPQTQEYARLIGLKRRLEQTVISGGWGGRVPEGAALRPGDRGPAVVALRDRLLAMGYLSRSAAADYDGALQAAVQAFQMAHGLTPDGIAGPATLAEINTGPEARLRSVIVALERARWTNFDRGARHIWVNLADFSARIVDDGKVTFETRSVIGMSDAARQTPEFSDSMTHLVLNPSWTVPRSIIARDYLPQLQRNPNAVSHLQLIDSSGRVVSRGAVNFAAYSARTFPFSLRQAPGPSNALGQVKFMFPNRHAIYLHDTPQRNLFSREVRAFSNGCIRLNDPLDFAYVLLARQEADPQGRVARILATGKETRVNLEEPVPIHLVYQTAFVGPRGEVQYRRDVYGRDARIFEALARAGVALPGGSG
jgi:murein L,D-transpeptidase YcbB/YkuD